MSFNNNGVIKFSPQGKWKIHINDKEPGELVIDSIDNQGKLTGTVFGKNMHGTFDLSTGKISFSYQVNAPALNVGNYDGYASIIPGSDPVKQHFLAGIYGLAERQNRYGWYATREGIIPL